MEEDCTGLGLTCHVEMYTLQRMSGNLLTDLLAPCSDNDGGCTSGTAATVLHPASNARPWQDGAVK